MALLVRRVLWAVIVLPIQLSLLVATFFLYCPVFVLVWIVTGELDKRLSESLIAILPELPQ